MVRQNIGQGVVTFTTVFMASLLAAAGVFVVLTLELIEAKKTSRHDLIQMTDSFVTAYAEARGPDAVLPAAYRRFGIEKFTALSADNEDEPSVSMRVPGTPGLEISVTEEDPRLRYIIQRLDAFGRNGHTETRFEQNRLIGRTIYPVNANTEGCVSCHNSLLGNGRVAEGDTLGAYIVETDLTKPALTNLYYSSVAFAVFLGAFSLLGRREYLRMRDTVHTLRNQVFLEREKREAEEYAKFIAKHDALTGLPNRGLFLEKLDILIRKSPEDLVVALIDLDDFKGVNDAFGHDVGDALLQQRAYRLQDSVEKWGGMIARLGGDEFGAIIHRKNLDIEPARLGEALLEAFKEPVHHGKLVVRSQATIGIVSGTPRLDDTEALLKRADMALYVAKDLGKGRFAVYDQTIAKALRRRSMIEEALPKAIADGRIIPAFQPKVCLDSGKILGFEVLARWKHLGENMPPAEFTRIAEEISLTREIDLAILRQGALIAGQIEEKTGHAIHLATNLSPKNFGSPSIAEDIADILFKTGLPPERLTIEVTETFPLNNWEVVSKCLDKLRGYGIRTALDDFGTGYSSLSCLQKLRVDEVKIDRDFVCEIENNEETAILFESIVAMVNGLGRRVVVEGIETEAQARLVKERGAHIGQGYLYAKPVSPADLATLLSRFDPNKFRLSA